MVYKWKIASLHQTDPSVAAKIFGDLAAQGMLNAETLVEISRPEEAPLHKEFDWNDSVAAEKWRCHQGRNLINALVMVDESRPNAEPIRAFFRVEDISPQYESTEVLIRTIDGKLSMLKKARGELQTFRMKYATVLAYCHLLGLIDDTIVGINQAIDSPGPA